MSRLSNADREQYVKDGGNKCPFCRSTDLDGGKPQVDGPRAWCVIMCLNCGEEWHDIYTLTDIQYEM